jgi:hypothetical protein
MMKRKAKGSHILSSPPQVHKSFAKFTRVWSTEMVSNKKPYLSLQQNPPLCEYGKNKTWTLQCKFCLLKARIGSPSLCTKKAGMEPIHKKYKANKSTRGEPICRTADFTRPSPPPRTLELQGLIMGLVHLGKH